MTSRTATYDAVVIGAGHNGLICAAYLAKAGRRVLVLERRSQVGGATTTEEIYPGFRYTSCSYVVPGNPRITTDAPSDESFPNRTTTSPAGRTTNPP